MNLGIVVTTYNSPAWLEKVLWGYEHQTDANFEIIIADDGSTQQTTDLIDRFKQRDKLNLLHVWHEDDGFRKTKILNKAIIQTASDYLIFTDGDCIPRADFVAVHKSLAKPGYFLSGGYFKLNMSVSQQVTEQDIISGDVFDKVWLLNNGQKKSHKMMKLTAQGVAARLLEVLTPTNASWNGMNSSTWKDNIIGVNGFNEEMSYGGEDREMGERMMNVGLKGKQIRYSAICLHLDHKRGYATPETWEKNRIIRQRVKNEKLVWTEHGIKK
jgi:glycosyltransferase involved in cell wall biosynthesis